MFSWNGRTGYTRLRPHCFSYQVCFLAFTDSLNSFFLSLRTKITKKHRYIFCFSQDKGAQAILFFFYKKKKNYFFTLERERQINYLLGCWNQIRGEKNIALPQRKKQIKFSFRLLVLRSRQNSYSILVGTICEMSLSLSAPKSANSSRILKSQIIYSD